MLKPVVYSKITISIWFSRWTNALSLNYWLSKFVREVACEQTLLFGGVKRVSRERASGRRSREGQRKGAKSSSKRYLPGTVYGIISGIRRYLAEKKPGDDLNLLSTRITGRFLVVTSHHISSVEFKLPIWDSSFLAVLNVNHVIFRRALDAEMKDAARAGVTLTNKKKENVLVTENKEQKFWEMGLLGCKSAKSLLHTVYYYEGKLFGLCGGEYRNITVANFDSGSNFIRFEENVVKTFYGVLTDLKYKPRVVTHLCHPFNAPLSSFKRKTRMLSCWSISYVYLGLVQAYQGHPMSIFGKYLFRRRF